MEFVNQCRFNHTKKKKKDTRFKKSELHKNEGEMVG